MSDKPSLLAKRIKEERLKKGIKQGDLGKLVGVTSSAVGYWESGKRIPDIKVIETFADYFDCTVDYLVGRTNERKPLSEDDPQKAEIINRARSLSPEAWEKFRNAVEWVFEIDKDREELERLKKRSKKDLGN